MGVYFPMQQPSVLNSKKARCVFLKHECYESVMLKIKEQYDLITVSVAWCLLDHKVNVQCEIVNKGILVETEPLDFFFFLVIKKWFSGLDLVQLDIIVLFVSFMRGNGNQM